MGRHTFRCQKNGGLDFSKPPLIKCKMSVEKGLPSSGFFIVVRQEYFCWFLF